MKTLGIQVHHNSSACLVDSGSLVYFNLEERVSRRKNKSGIPWEVLKQIRKITKEIDHLVISGYDVNADDLLLIVSSLHDAFDFNIKQYYYYHKSHHLAHAFKAFCSSSFSEAIVVVWDGRGSAYSLSDGTSAFESTSVFHISYENGINLLQKTLIRLPGTAEAKDVLSVLPSTEGKKNNLNDSLEFHQNCHHNVLTNRLDIGYYYDVQTKHLGFDPLQGQGKVLGLHSYGEMDFELEKLIYDETSYTFKPDLLTHDFEAIDFSVNSTLSPEEANKKSLVNFTYVVQKSLEKIGLKVITEALDTGLSDNLILTGGVSLNIVANSYYKKHLSDKMNMYVEPLCGDEGNSIGIAQLYIFDKLKQNPVCAYSIYACGEEPSYELSLKAEEHVFEGITHQRIVELLTFSNIIALFQGKAEAGPRALGNRSLLFDPRVKNGKEIVNTVKRRESFRPFACSILEEEAYKWFDMSYISNSPYMVYAVEALPGVRDIIPSVVHVDNTCRIQTVNENQNKHYYNLIKCFHENTKVPLLFNTSFNLAGDPIVETLEDALLTLRESNLEYLYLPEVSKLVYSPNKN